MTRSSPDETQDTPAERPYVEYGEAAHIVFDLAHGNAEGLREKLLKRPQFLAGRLMRGNHPEKTLVHLAAQPHMLQVLAEVARECGVVLDIDAKAISGQTPLVEAIRSGHFEKVQTLLDLGANPNGAGVIKPVAAAAGRPWGAQMAAMLIKAGAHPDGAESIHPLEETPLFDVARKGDSATALVLLAAGADGNRDVNGSTPAHAADEFGRPETAEAIRGWLNARLANKLIAEIAAKTAKSQCSAP